MFELVSKYNPSGDQPQAIEQLTNNLRNGVKYQTLLGATGTGKTFTIANVIEKINQYRTDENGALVFTADTHFENYMDTQEGKNLPVPHCIKDTYGWQFKAIIGDPIEGTMARSLTITRLA